MNVKFIGRWIKLTGVGVLIGADVVQLDDVTALAAALERAVTGHLERNDKQPRLGCQESRHSTYRQPVDLVRVGRVASATGVLLVTGTVDNDGVVKGA